MWNFATIYFKIIDFVEIQRYNINGIFCILGGFCVTEAMKNDLIDKMQENLQILRLKLKLTQKGLAEMIGVSRYTIMSIENRNRQMSWSTFLALILIFSNNKDTDAMLSLFGIYTDELNNMIKSGCD